MNLQNKTALVTGGAVRVGKALALALAREGVRVAVHYNSSAGPAEETVTEIQALGQQAIAIQADLSQPTLAAGVIDRAVEHLGPLDILVNSASIFERVSLEATTEDVWDRHFDINLKSPFFLSQAFAAQVGKDRPGQIVNIADWRAIRPDANYVAYSLTKSALVSMTQVLALALGPNIQVNAIAPGAILPPPGKGEVYFEQLAASIPLKRVGSPGEIARALVYLLKSDFVTGETMFVTGGEHLV